MCYSYVQMIDLDEKMSVYESLERTLRDRILESASLTISKPCLTKERG